MHSRKYVTPIEDLKATANELIKTSKDRKFVHRVECVNLVLNGTTPSKLSKSVREGTSTITMWVKKADELGFESLKDKKSPGRPKKLQEESLHEIKAALIEKPETHGFRVWDGPSLSAFIKREYNTDLGVRQCQRLLHKLGFSLVRPRTMPTKGEDNEEERDDFKKKFKNLQVTPM